MSMIEKLFTWSNMPAYQSWGNFGLTAVAKLVDQVLVPPVAHVGTIRRGHGKHHRWSKRRAYAHAAAGAGPVGDLAAMRWHARTPKWMFCESRHWMPSAILGAPESAGRSYGQDRRGDLA